MDVWYWFSAGLATGMALTMMGWLWRVVWYFLFRIGLGE